MENDILKEETPVAVIFMGLQASGKSTFYRRIFGKQYVHINLDTLHTRNQERIALENCIAEGKSFVVDNTNPTKADRARYIPLAKAAGYRIVGYFFESKLLPCMERNNKRTGKVRVPDVALFATSNRLEMPSFAEGFDELYFVGMDEAAPGKNKPMIVTKWRENDEL